MEIQNRQPKTKQDSPGSMEFTICSQPYLQSATSYITTPTTLYFENWGGIKWKHRSVFCI